MGNQLCACCKRGEASSDDIDKLLPPRNEYVPPSTSTVQRTVLKVTHPTSPKQVHSPHHVAHSRKAEESRDEETAPALLGNDELERPRSNSGHKRVHHHTTSSHHRHQSHPPPDDTESTEANVKPERESILRDDSLNSSGSFESPRPSTDSNDPEGWTTAVSPSSKKKNKRKAKYGRANYRADSTKRTSD
ncbi:unnamed protein product [Aphanomyces euteiches]|uniref:Uncharacterized protein n=1 Tax=Aphanomyces euteiches TaxID=100861 RepID=A0A6G0WW95_9STRA|nr:hypothetical protein Ae201684_011099 [Aphanomyces euteiches]KAH9058435.1 hypothetical protein Ae201684P_005778 [Aphanomyces euteiches]KAH9136141.1 hypothetical protein AeRB84_018609 [Aphanomyces euteiches]